LTPSYYSVGGTQQALTDVDIGNLVGVYSIDISRHTFQEQGGRTRLVLNSNLWREVVISEIARRGIVIAAADFEF